MLSKPFNLLSSKNLSSLPNSLIKQHQNFASKLLKEIKNAHQNKNQDEEFEIIKFAEKKKGKILREEVLIWLSTLSLEEKAKICTIKDKWLTLNLFQMYLLFQKDNTIRFEPNNEMKVFFSEIDSLNSFKLLNTTFSPNDENKNSNIKEGEENTSNQIQKEAEIETDDLYFYKNYFKINQIVKNDEKEKFENEFIEYIKFIPLNKNEFDSITINSNLLSDMKIFKKYFKYFTDDKYFEEWLWPFKNKDGILNFKMPAWMRKTNFCFSLCQIFFGFLEQQILLYYEYFYYTKKIYELPYHKEIKKLYEENNRFETLLNMKPEYLIIRENIIEQQIKVIKNKKDYLEKYKQIRNIGNKVYLDKFNANLYNLDNLFQKDLKTIIYNEFKNYIKDKDINQIRKKFIEKMTFLNFKEVSNNCHYIYFPYKAFLIKYLCKIIAKEKDNTKKNKNKKEENKLEDINKINNINEIHRNFNQNKEENKSNDKIIRIISKTTLTTNQDSICEEESISLNNEINQKTIQNRNQFIKKDSYSSIIYKGNNINNNPDEIFKMQYHFYYNQGIANYCYITNYNVEILNKLKNKKLEIIKNIIESNLKDYFCINFGYYGSFFTGLSIEGSDLDICIHYKPKNKDINIDFSNKLFELLKNLKPLIYEINDYRKSSIPVINLEIDITEEIKKTPLCNVYQYIDYEDLTKIKIDITYNENKEFLDNCEKNVEYVKDNIKKYPQIKPVLLLLKRYFKKIGMNKVFFGGISSFSLFLLVLNVIKSEKRFIKNINIEVSELFLLVLQKFSTFDFDSKGIDIDNYDYQLDFVNQEKKIYILNPLNGLNISNGKCKPEKIRNSFFYAYKVISSQINYFKNNFYSGVLNPFNIIPINSIADLLNTSFNQIKNLFNC